MVFLFCSSGSGLLKLPASASVVKILGWGAEFAASDFGTVATTKSYFTQVFMYHSVPFVSDQSE